MKTLETTRLILRDWNESDIGSGVYSEKSIRYLMSVKNNYAIILKENNKVIGTIGINEDAEGNENARNVGVRIIPEYRNRGLISEALRAVIDNAHMITDTLSWLCKSTDTRSRHLAEKFGFTYVKTFYNVKRKSDEEPHDFDYFILNTKRGLSH